jgi:preprotein translocase subunit SecA
MFEFITNKIMGSQSERFLKAQGQMVARINALEEKMKKMTDGELRLKTGEFKTRLAELLNAQQAEFALLDQAWQEAAIPEEKMKVKVKRRDLKNKIFDELLPEAFAVVREAGRRTINLRHFDVQLYGGIALHKGMIAEMATGEGKTLVATLAAYLNALEGKGVHIVTVNDYLAKRDRYWMGPIYEFLGLSVGFIQHDSTHEERQKAYHSDITYGTNNEFGFDYLRDNMVVRPDDMVQGELNYAIVDEVDSILIDESRTPLIISGPAEESTEKYYQIDKIIPNLKGRIVLESEEIDAKYKGVDLAEGYDYLVDEKAHTAALTEQGIKKAEGLLGIGNLYEETNRELVHHINQALRAHNLFKLDRDYVVKNGEVIIVDEFTGRMMPGRRWSDGLHQAIEAKEKVKIERENQTLATITFQNYFRMYDKLAGMTGTAATEAAEFSEIYKLEVITIPTNRKLIRTNHPDVVYKSKKEKFRSAVEEIAELYAQGRPVLVGTISIEISEYLSELLKRKGIAHNVLNAKYHELEAKIVAQAGRLKTVTIATNMAGRGTDILLGGNAEFMCHDYLAQQGLKRDEPTYEEAYKKMLPEFKAKADEEHQKVVALGGLHILGTERHEARRIDNQLRGRSGRQGDPGSSRFYVSLEDDLMRLFASDRIAKMMDFFKWEEDLPLEHMMISKSIETAQKRVEMHNFEIRKTLLKFDNVMNRHREVIYDLRRQILRGEGVDDFLGDALATVSAGLLEIYFAQNTGEIDFTGLKEQLRLKYTLNLEEKFASASRDELDAAILQKFSEILKEKEKSFGSEAFAQMKKFVLLEIIDTKWKDHLYAMDELREGINLRAYAERDPFVEYQQEAFRMFAEMFSSVGEEALEFILKAQPLPRERARSVFSEIPQELIHQEAQQFQNLPPPAAEPEMRQDRLPQGPPPEQAAPYKREAPKVGRNDPCPCGSGKKYKKCCGK